METKECGENNSKIWPPFLSDKRMMRFRLRRFPCVRRFFCFLCQWEQFSDWVGRLSFIFAMFRDTEECAADPGGSVIQCGVPKNAEKPPEMAVFVVIIGGI